MYEIWCDEHNRRTTYSSASGDTNAEVTEVRSMDDHTELVLEICAGRRLITTEKVKLTR